MTNIEATTRDKPAAVAAQTAHVAPEKDSSKKAPTSKKGAPTGRKAAKGGKTGKTKAAAAKKAAKAGKTGKKAAKPARAKPAAAKKASAPRAESKGGKILALVQRPKGATLAEIMKAADWQAHSVRGFISTASKKHGIKVESTKSEAGERLYRSAK